MIPRKLKPTTLITITESNLVNDRGESEFYSKYMFLNIKNHHPYSSLLRINVLYLDQTELATEEDIANDLVHWARMFKATTWEEIKTIADGNPVFEEVASRMYSANTIPEEKTMIEAHERFLAMKRGAYEKGYDDASEKYDAIIEETVRKNTELSQEIAELKARLAKYETNEQ